MSFQAYAAATATAVGARSRQQDWVLAPGSLLKIDLSGFTRLSERLARSELTGAERLNAVLTSVFTALIDEVLERGGDVLQFGGDALVVWFEGDGHAVRAVTAARAMQRRLAERPAERTPAGPVRLRMSAGLATGEVLMTVVGADHRELLTLGPVASRVEAMEKKARSGQLLLDAATAAALRPAETRQVAPDAWLSRASPAELPHVRTKPAGAGAAELVPPDVRELVLAGQRTGEHRRAAAAFLGTRGLDALLADEGPDAVVARVRRVAGAVDEAVAATGVTWTATDLMADGAVFLLFAGAPVAREDDEERLLRACRTVADACPDEDLRIGAHAGRVFAADIGHPERRTFAIIGDTTNLAARLMHRAAAGEVLVTEDLFGPSDRDHDVVWAEPFTVRGRSTPVRAGLLGPRTTTAASRRSHDLPLVGREAERAVLASLVDAVRGAAGQPLRVAVTGDPGVGKSRLVEGALEDLAGLGVLHAAPTVFDTAVPYGALRAPLRRLLGLDDVPTEEAAALLAGRTSRPELLPLLNLPLDLDLPGTAATADLDPRFLQERRNAVLAEVLRSGGDAPVLVVVEDLHWLDRASAGLLDALARQSRPGELGLLVTSRDDVSGHLETAADWQVVALEALGREAARALALEASGAMALSDSDLDRLVRETGGNPLFLRELVSFRPTAEGELPATAEEVITARIDATGPRWRRVLRDASVGGPVQRLDDLAGVLDDPGLLAPAAWSPVADFVAVEATAEGDRLVFRHELYRQSAYQGLAVRRRRDLHARWADHLLGDRAGAGQRDVAVATVAGHLYDAGRFGDAWEWGRRAAHEARAGGALDDAVLLYQRALTAGRRAGAAAPALAEAEEALGDTAELVGRYAVADAALRDSARTAGPTDAVRRMVKRATVLERQARYRPALALLTRAEKQLIGSEAIGPEADAVRAALVLRRSSVEHRLGRFRRAYDLSADVAATADRSDGPLRVERARALLRLEMVASEAGWPERFELGREALRAFEGLDEDRDLASLLANIGVTLWEADDWSGARRRYEESMEVCRRTGDVLGAAISANNVGEILCEQGDLGAAREVFEDARRVFRAAGHAWGVACTASALGRIEAREGSTDSAATLLAEAVASLEAMGSTVFAADARVRQVELALLEQRPHALTTAVAEEERLAGTEVGEVLRLTAARYRAVALVGEGRTEDARRLAEQVRARAVEAGAVHEEGLALDLLVALAEAEGSPASHDLVARRDAIWRQLGVQRVVRYPQLGAPAPAGD